MRYRFPFTGFLSIVVWFLVFLPIDLMILQCLDLPASSKIPRIFFIENGLKEEKAKFGNMLDLFIDDSVCIVGDCAAFSCNWHFAKRAKPGADIEDLINEIKEKPLPAECGTIVIMWGTKYAIQRRPSEFIQTESDRLARRLRRLCPGKKIFIIPISEIVKLAEKPEYRDGDRYHLNGTGYDVLRKRFEHIFIE